MVKRPQRSRKPAEAASQPAQWTHDWHPYNDYLDVHTSHMDALMVSGQVVRNGLSFTETRGGGKQGQELQKVRVAGSVECADDVLIVVDKWLEVRRGLHNRYEVRGYSYSYHAWLRNRGDLIRYDSAHGMDGLHCHRLDADTRQIGVTEIALEDLPTLTDFIDEALTIAGLLTGMGTS